MQAAATLYNGGRQYRIQAAALYIMAAARLEVSSHVCYDSRGKYLAPIKGQIYDTRNHDTL